MAQKPPIGTDAPGVTDEALKAQVDVDLRDYYTRLTNEALTALKDFQQQGLEGDALADAVAARLQGLSDQPIIEAGRASTSEAFNLGCNLAAQVLGPQIGEVVRTAVLDENTCDPCDLLDGSTYEVNTPAYFESMPPNFCDGRDLCRCFYFYKAAA